MVEHRSPKPGVGSSSLSSRANIIEMKKVIAYIKESYDELVHKVSWPTYSELANSAVVVICFPAYCIGSMGYGCLFPELHGKNCLSTLKN